MREAIVMGRRVPVVVLVAVAVAISSLTGFLLIKARGGHGAEATLRMADTGSSRVEGGGRGLVEERAPRSPLGGAVDASTARIEGLVVDADGQPARGATVVVAQGRWRVTTSDDGLFFVDGVPVANYSVWAERGSERSRQASLLAGATYSRNVLQLQPSATLRVVVTDARTSAPVPGAAVELEGHGAVATDAEGRAPVPLHAGGELTLAVAAAGFAKEARSIFLPEVAQAIPPVYVQLRAGYTISGQVRGSSGEPEPLAQVELHDASQVSRRTALSAVAADASGVFRTAAVRDGSYILTARGAQGGLGQTEILIVRGLSQDGVVINLGPVSELVGTVVDAGGAPVAGAAVTVHGPRGAVVPLILATAQSDPAGRFRSLVSSGLAVEVEAEHASGGSDRVMVDVPTSHELRLVVDSWLSIAGSVVDPSGNAVPDVSVVARPVGDLRESAGGEGRRDATSTTAADGRFSLQRLRKARYILFATGPGRSPYGAFGALRPVTEVDAGAQQVRIVLADDFSITGQVAFPDGRTVEAVRLWIDGRGPLQLGAPSGTFHVGDVPPGERVVTIKTDDSLARSISVRGSAGQELDLGVITLEAGLTAQGIVVDERGAPVHNAEVMAVQSYVADGNEAASPDTRDAADFAMTRSGQDGSFVLSGVTQGSLLVAQHPSGGRSPPTALVPARMRLVLGQQCSVAGTLLQDGKSQAQSLIALHSSDGTAAAAASRAERDPALTLGGVTDLRGRFSISGVPEGTYRVVALAERGKSVRSFVVPEVLTVDGCPRAIDHDVHVPGGRGRLAVARRSARPQPAREVLVWGSDTFERAVVSAGGSAEFDDLRSGDYEVCLKGAGSREQDPPCRTVLVEEGQTAQVEFVD